MRVDQQAALVIVAVPGQMNFCDGLRWKAVQVGSCREPQIVSAHVDVVDVQQQTTTGATCQFAKKVDLVPFMALQLQVMTGVFDGYPPAQNLLASLDVFSDALQGFVAARKWQQVWMVVPLPG